MKAALRAVKNSVYQFEEIEVQVREATSSDRWGVTDSAMADIARATNDYNAYPKLFAMLWKRLTDVEHVMHVQKALILVEYLLRYGSERFITDAKRRSRDIAALQKYKHYDENNQDDAKEARAKAKLVTDLLSDERRLGEERSKAQKMKENMRGFGSNDYAGGGPSYRDPVNNSYGNAYGNGSYDDDHRDTPAQREAPRQSFDEDPYGESKAKSAVPKTEEDDEAERKRKKKEKKREKEAKEAAAAAAASASSSSAQADDPFASSVIPSSVGGGAAAEAPASEEKKKKKKKDKSGAEAPAAASAASQYAAVAAAAPARSADVDLTSFADSGSNRGGGGGSGGSGDFDFLSGNQHGGGQDLSSMFGATSISSQPTLWDQPAESNNNEEFGFGSDSGAAAASQSSSASAAQTTPPKQKADIWSSDLFNLERLDQNPAQANKKANVVEGGVSMSMMKNLNPNAVPTPKRGGSSGSFNFGAPAAGPGPAAAPNNAFAHTGGFAAPGAYGQAPPPPLGPMGYGQQPGYGAPYGQPQGYPQQPGYGAPYGAAPRGYPPQGYGAPPQGYGAPPMSYGGGMGMMPQGGAGGFPGAGPQGAPFGAPQQRPAQSLDPFASLTPGLSSKPNANKSMDFFVPAARK